MKEHIAERGGALKTAQNSADTWHKPTYRLYADKKRFIPERPHGQRHPNYKEQL